jgi:two-component system response regulator RegX3
MKEHVLIVEDDEQQRSFLALHLENADYKISSAATGEEALSIYAREKIDLILLDLTLPDLDGLEILEQIRRESKVPILILTARKSQMDKLIGLGFGASAYLAKPVDPKEFILRVGKLLDPNSLEETEPAMLF